MMLVRREAETAAELRDAWVHRRPVVLSLSERCEPRRLEGRVRFVAVTGAFVVVEYDGPLHVPMMDVLAVHRPHHTQNDQPWKGGDAI